MYKKRCSPICTCMEHPVIAATVMGLAIFGAVGVVMALKNQARPLARAAKRMSCTCMDNVRERTEDILDDGLEAMQRMMRRKTDGYGG